MQIETKGGEKIMKKASERTLSEQLLDELVVFELLNAKATELVQEARGMITSSKDPEQYIQDNADRLRGILNVALSFYNDELHHSASVIECGLEDIRYECLGIVKDEDGDYNDPRHLTATARARLDLKAN